MYHILDLHFQGSTQVIGAFVVPSQDGWILIETGPHSCWPALVSGLAEHGLEPGDIRHVLLTHIHLDHAGAAWAFAEQGAQIYVHPAGAAHLIDPSKLMASARRIYQDQMDVLWGEMHPIGADQVTSVADKSVLDLGGVRLVAHHTPGHAMHHIAWQMDRTLFTGDVAGIQINGGIVAPPCPPPEFDLTTWLASITLMQALDVDEFVLTHFGPVTDKENHFDHLVSALHQWVGFFEQKPDWMDQEKLTREFVHFIHAEFYTPDMDKALRAKYDSANPPWMSVAGITRYLSRKQQA